MSFLSNLIKQAAPLVATFSEEPFSKAAATAITIGQQQQNMKYQKKLQDQQINQRNNNMANLDAFGLSLIHI